jgi:4-hydroxy-tetrahydrodipicolinate synthase
MPRICAEVFKAGVVDNDIPRARSLFEPIYPICEFMSARGYIRVAYTACEILGYPMGRPRAPVGLLNDADRNTLAGLLKNAGLLSDLAA